MAQANTRFCPQCGTAVTAEQRFCSNCGYTMEIGSVNPTALASTQMSSGNESPVIHQTDVPPPPPPDFTFYPPQQGGQKPSQPQQGFQPPPSGFQPQQPTPAYAKPVKDSSGSVMRQIGCIVGVIILVLVLICGGIGYFLYSRISSTANNIAATATAINTSINNPGGTTPGGTTPGVTPTVAPATSTDLNTTFSYSSIDFTLISVQQASSFSDDTGAGNNGVLRLNTKESNQSTQSVFYSYGDSMHLIMPDKTVVTSVNILKYNVPAPGVIQTNWWDFVIPTSMHADQLTLQVGTNAEAQLSIPLQAKTDLSKYQPKTTSPNKQTLYDGVTITFNKAILSYDAFGKQADKGKRYITISLTADNTSTKTVYLSDFLRLKAGSLQSAPTTEYYGFNIIDSGVTGKIATYYFLVPEGVTSFTLILRADATANPPIAQAQFDFQIQ